MRHASAGPMAAPASAEALNDISSRVIAAAIEIHRTLGPGLIESAYARCLDHQLRADGLDIARQVAIPLVYRDVKLDCVYRADILVEHAVLVEVKALDAIAPIHGQQLYTYLRLGHYRLGLLLNFGGATMKEGIRRVVNGFPDR
jgi:GxxExxY protein